MRSAEFQTHCRLLSISNRNHFSAFQLLQEQSDLWRNLITKMKQEGLYGSSLPLMCNNHPEHKVNVTKTEDFEKLPEGIG